MPPQTDPTSGPVPEPDVNGPAPALRMNETQLAAIIDSSLDAIVCLDAQLRITVFNRAAEKLFQCSAAQARQQELGRFLPDVLQHIMAVGVDEQISLGEVQGQKVLAFGTAYGDGVYADQFGNEFPVDAGLIGLVPEALVDMEELHANYPESHSELGIWVKYDYETVCETDGKTLRFGKHRIETDSDE